MIPRKTVVLLISTLSILWSCSNSNPKIIIRTELGDITLELYPEKAPITVANFLRYVDENRFDGATFYRVVTKDNQPGSETKIEVIQGGLFDDDHPQALPPIKHETTEETGILHKDGAISMARYGPGTATGEFFICVGDQPSLDSGGKRNPDKQGFAAFGKIIKGMDIVREIQKQPAKDQYLEPRIKITEIKVIR